MSLPDEILDLLISRGSKGLTTMEMTRLLSTSNPSAEVTRLRQKYPSIEFPYTRHKNSRGKWFYRYYYPPYAPKDAA